MAEWQQLTVGDLCSRITSGGTPSRSKPEFYEPGEIPWVKTGDLTDSMVSSYDEHISIAGLENSSAKMLPPGTVLMAMYGATVGRLGILAESASCNQAACAMIVDPAKSDSRWLFYKLLQERPRMIGLANGAAQQNLNAGTIREFRLSVPKLEEQRAIADVLAALDDKIAANTRIAASAAQLSRALYEAALAEGDHRRGKFFEYFTVTFGAAFKGDQFSDPGSGRPLLRIRDLKTFVPQVWTTEKRRDETVVSPGDVLVGMDGDFSPTPWFGVEGVLNQRVCSVQSSNSRAFTLEAIRAPIAFIEGHKAGTTVIHLNKKDLAETPVVLPSADAAGSFDARASRLLDVQVRALSENRALTALRDTLLPQLMSGKLRVREAAEMAGL